MARTPVTRNEPMTSLPFTPIPSIPPHWIPLSDGILNTAWIARVRVFRDPAGIQVAPVWVGTDPDQHIPRGHDADRLAGMVEILGGGPATPDDGPAAIQADDDGSEPLILPPPPFSVTRHD